VITRLPLRTSLVATVLLLAALAVAATSAAATLVLRGYLLDRVDQQLADSLRPAAEVLVRGQGPGDGRGPQDRLVGAGDFYAGLYDATGELLRSIEPVAESSQPDLPVLDSDEVAELSGDPFTTGSVEGRERWRVLVAPLGGGLSVAVAQSLEGIDETVGRLILIEVVVGVIALGVLAAMAWWTVRRSLRPLVEVERTADSIARGDLSQRVPESDPRTEVGSLSASLNTMLGQIEESFRAQEASEAEARASEERMRRFVADASHELRTPLTSIRGFAELYRQGAVPVGDDLDRAMGRIEGEAVRMGLLVEDLLLLARMDQQRPLRSEPVDLLGLAADTVADAGAAAPDHPVALRADEGLGELIVLGDEDRLRQVLANLVSNATSHTPPGTPVELGVAAEGGEAVLIVRDEGPGMDDESAARAFERFYRSDPSRTREPGRGGAGLGLSIVAALVAAHGGRVELATAPGEGATFTVRLPLAGAGDVPVDAGGESAAAGDGPEDQ
jgi:two-component system OmpR family sensor kinase